MRSWQRRKRDAEKLACIDLLAMGAVLVSGLRAHTDSFLT